MQSKLIPMVDTRDGNLFSDVGVIYNETFAQNLIIEARSARASRAWGPRARLRASMGSRGKDPGGVVGAKPPEAPGFYSIFSAKYSYCLSLSYMLTHSSLKRD